MRESGGMGKEVRRVSGYGRVCSCQSSFESISNYYRGVITAIGKISAEKRDEHE
jgi:hypothetical protein